MDDIKSNVQCIPLESFENFHAGCVLVGKDWRYLYVNKSAEKHWRKKKEELLGKTVSEIVPGIEKTELFTAIKIAIDDGKPGHLASFPLFPNDDPERYEFNIEIFPHGVLIASHDVTEESKIKEKTEEAIREMNQAEELLGVGSWIALGMGENSSNTIWWSPEMYRRAEVDSTKKDLTFKDVLDLFPQEEAQIYEGLIRRALETKAQFEIELPMVPGKKTRWVICRGGPIFDKDGKIVGLRGTAQDITERKKIEIALEHSAHEMSEAQHLAKIGSFTAMGDGSGPAVITWSPEMYEIAEVDRTNEAPTLEDVTKMLLPEYAQKYVEEIQKMPVEKKGFELELRVIPGKKVEWIVSRVVPIFDTGGNFIGLRGTAQDITERKVREEEIRQINIELNDAEKMAKVGNWMAVGTDPINAKVSWSKELFRIADRDPEKFVPSLSAQMDLFAPEDAGKLASAVTHSMTSGQSYDLELRTKAGPEGKIKWIFSHGEMLLNEKGEVIGMHGTAQDITEQKSLELKITALNRALKAISDSNQSLIRAKTEEEILQKMCNAIVDAGYGFTWIGYPENDNEKTVRPIARAGYDEGYLDVIKISWADNELGNGPTGLAIRTGEPHILNDISSAPPSYSPWKEEAVKRKFKSSVALPIMLDGVVGALNIYSYEANVFDEEEMGLLKELASDLSYGIRALRNAKEKEKNIERIKELSDVRSKFLAIVSH